jgi:hypothetical protein
MTLRRNGSMAETNEGGKPSSSSGMVNGNSPTGAGISLSVMGPSALVVTIAVGSFGSTVL